MQDLSISRRAVLATGLAATGWAISANAWAQTPAQAAIGVQTTTTIKASDGRDVTVFIWSPVGAQRGVILFSHGAVSSPDKYLPLIGPWTRAGFKVYAPVHVDSPEHANHAELLMFSWACRILDMGALSAFVKAPSYVAAGHSYGALTALTLGGVTGESPVGMILPPRDPRCKAVLAHSPPGPTPTLITAEGFKTLQTPAMIQTGDKDIFAGATDPRWQVHLTAYEQAPAGDKYGLVLTGADHYFGNIICSPERPGPPQTAPLALAVKASGDFLAAYGAGDAAARRRLDGLSTDRLMRIERK